MAPRSCRHCSGHTPENGVDPLAKLRQGNQPSGTVIVEGSWGSLAVKSSPSRRKKTPKSNSGGSTFSPARQLPRGRKIPIKHQPSPLELVVGPITLHRKKYLITETRDLLTKTYTGSSTTPVDNYITWDDGRMTDAGQTSQGSPWTERVVG